MPCWTVSGILKVTEGLRVVFVPIDSVLNLVNEMSFGPLRVAAQVTVIFSVDRFSSVNPMAMGSPRLKVKAALLVAFLRDKSPIVIGNGDFPPRLKRLKLVISTLTVLAILSIIVGRGIQTFCVLSKLKIDRLSSLISREASSSAVYLIMILALSIVGEGIVLSMDTYLKR